MIVQKESAENINSTSFEKSIDTRDMDVMYTALQSSAYRYPIKSSIRETASNGVDSHIERDMAIDILRNGAPVSKYFEEITDENGTLHASRFDREYYDLEWLSDKREVEIRYIERNQGRDLIRFEDWGVGLGEKRLEGFFNLGFSSKRASKKLIGG